MRTKIRIGVTVECDIYADGKTVKHFAATGEMTDALKFSIERAEIAIQAALDKRKRLNAVVGADYGSAHINEA